MSFSKYKDPPDHAAILTKLVQDVKTIKDVKELVDEVFPGWIITFLPGFSDDYPHLNRNWLSLCTMHKTHPRQIMIVDNYPNIEGDYTLVGHFCECFSRAGFMVRKMSEYIPCSVCNRALPTKAGYKALHSNGVKEIPGEYRTHCSTCIPRMEET
jgi:hypothetical protein